MKRKNNRSAIEKKKKRMQKVGKLVDNKVWKRLKIDRQILLGKKQRKKRFQRRCKKAKSDRESISLLLGPSHTTSYDTQC